MSERSAASLPDRQRAVLSAIRHYCGATGEVPTLSYLARRLSLDRSTVREHLEALHRKGFLRAPTPGPVSSEPLPIPPRDEDEPAPIVVAAAAPPVVLPPSVTVEKMSQPGESAPSTIVVKDGTRIRRMRVLRTGGLITGLEVEEG